MFICVNVDVVFFVVLDECVEVHPCSGINATTLWETSTETLQQWDKNNVDGIKMQTPTFSLA